MRTRCRGSAGISNPVPDRIEFLFQVPDAAAGKTISVPSLLPVLCTYVLQGAPSSTYHDTLKQGLLPISPPQARQAGYPKDSRVYTKPRSPADEIDNSRIYEDYFHNILPVCSG